MSGIKVTRFPADWKRYGRRAGPIRNTDMAESEALVAVWDGRSRGTGNMNQLVRRRGLQVFVYYTTPERETFQAWKEWCAELASTR